MARQPTPGQGIPAAALEWLGSSRKSRSFVTPLQLSLVLPCFNEEGNIEATLADVLGWFSRGGAQGEVIAVDDGSLDATRAILQRLAARHPTLRIVAHEANGGYGSAIRSGCDVARSAWIGFMDSDGQFRAGEFDRLIPHSTEFDFVAGRRAVRADPFPRGMNAGLYGLLLLLVLGLRVPDINCGMKLFRGSIWPKMRPSIGTGALFNAEMFYRMSKQGIPWKQVPVPHYPRERGRPTGARASVILRMFRELLALKREGLGRGQG